MYPLCEQFMIYSVRNTSIMKSFKNIPVKFKPTPITIKEPYKPDVKEFADTEDFTCYFRANEDTFKEAPKSEEDEPKFLTANKLNRTYKVPGYRIRIMHKGTDHEELTLVKDYTSRSSEPDTELVNNTLDEVTIERIDNLEKLIQGITDQINNIETFLCQLRR